MLGTGHGLGGLRTAGGIPGAGCSVAAGPPVAEFPPLLAVPGPVFLALVFHARASHILVAGVPPASVWPRLAVGPLLVHVEPLIPSVALFPVNKKYIIKIKRFPLNLITLITSTIQIQSKLSLTLTD